MGYLPGTTVETEDIGMVSTFLSSAFTVNGLVLSQIVSLTGLEAHTVQNWVKRRFILSPSKKKYDCNSFCRLAIINTIKDSLKIENIVEMLNYVEQEEAKCNDTFIYLTFCELLKNFNLDAINSQTYVAALARKIANMQDVGEAAKLKLEKILKIMALAYIAATIKKQTQIEFNKLDI